MQGAVEKLLYNVATVYLYVVFISILVRMLLSWFLLLFCSCAFLQPSKGQV